MNYENITTCDVANGEDIGVVLWVSGCDIHCPGCHNQETWDPNSGKKFTKETKALLYKELEKPHIHRLTISGGHPLMPCNRHDIRLLVQDIRNDFPALKIWLYTGYNYNDMNNECKYICSLCDVIIEGPFIEQQKDLSLPFRGSKNQNIIRNDGE